MNRDDVVPPSPPVKLNKSIGRTKQRRSNSSRQRKRNPSILSLRAKRNQILINEYGQNVSTTTSSGETIENDVSPDDCQVNIYAGLDHASIEEKQHTESFLNNFDILGQSKLLENCNEYDLSQINSIQEKCISQKFPETRGLVSLKELLTTQNIIVGEQIVHENEPDLPNVENSFVDEAKEVSRDNIQFSEWPLPSDYKIIDEHTSDDHTQNDSKRINSIVTQNNSNLSFTVQSILDDFDDDNSSQEDSPQTPPVTLIRRAHRKTYERTHTVKNKILLFNDEKSAMNSNENEIVKNDDDCCDDFIGTQCTQNDDIGIDLNSSRKIVENLTQLNSFFAHSQSYELNFNTDLSHTIPDFEKRFDEVVSDSDDYFSCARKYNSFPDIEFNIPVESKLVEMESDEDDMFLNVETPKVQQRLQKNQSKTTENSTPLSSFKMRVEHSGMDSTPSTSKQVIPNEQRVPKRLRFGGEMDQTENSDVFVLPTTYKMPAKMMGFATARGMAIEMSATAMKKAADGFANIDNDYRHVDSSNNDPPNPKRIKHSENVEFTTETDTPIKSHCEQFGGFRSGKNTFLPQPKNNVRNIFGDEDFSDLGFSRPTTKFKSSTPGPSNTFQRGFTTAAGSSIKVSETNIQKYNQTLKDIDRKHREQMGIENDEPDFDENALACKTPLAKFNNRSNAFATSTPNPNSTIGFRSALPPITPNNQQNISADNEFDSWINQLDDQTIDEIMGTQQIIKKLQMQDKSSTNLNDTITSDIHPIADSFAEGANDVIQIPDEIKLARQKALSAQQTECFKKPHPIYPNIGWLFVHKLSNTKKLSDLGRPNSYKRAELEFLVVQNNVIDVNVKNALQFKFDMWKFYSLDVCQTNIDGIDVHDDMKLIMDENSRVGKKELTSAFLQCSSVDPKLIPDHWINNCLKWIIIKLASYERSFPNECAGNCLTPENVLAQLNFRYEREIDKVKRSAIRRIVEKDDSPAKRMVLFVSRILEHDLVQSLELSDGWYSIRTSSLDSILTNAITRKKIVVGTKLIVQGAEIFGIEEGCSPLEMPSSVALKISANSTRRAKWDTKLGYCRESWPFAISLNSIYGNGGIISRTKAYVLRVYPLIFAVKEKSNDGQKTVFRSNKVEQRQGKKDDKKHFEMIEKLYSDAAEKVEKEYEIKMKKYRSPHKKLCDIDDADELWNFMEYSNDGVSFDLDLSLTRKKLLTDYQTKFSDEKQNKIATIVREKLSALLQKIRLIDAVTPNASKTAILSIWNVNESHSQIRENTCLDLQYVTPNGMRGKDIQLTANNLTIIREIPLTSTSHTEFIRQLNPIAAIDPYQFKPHFNEFDTIGFVLKIDEVIPNQFQSVFLVDANKNILCIKFWHGIKQYAYEDIVEEKKFIVINQLDWRVHTRFNINAIPQAFVTEITTFSENPKPADRIAALSVLKEQFGQFDLTEYMNECLGKLQQNAQANKENSSINLPSNQHDLKVNQQNLNQTAPASSAAATNKPTLGIQQKIDRLRYYGSPPAFRSSYLKHNQNQTNFRKPFKNPSRQESTDS